MKKLYLVLILLACSFAGDNLELFKAAETGDLVTLEQSLDTGTSLYVQKGGDTSGDNLLMVAVKNNQTVIVKELLSRDMDVNRKNNIYVTALELSILEGNAIISDLLLKAGAKLPDGDEALVYFILAAERGDITTVKSFLDHGMDPNSYLTHAVFGKYSALTKAAEYGQDTIIKLLLDHGADYRFTTDDGYTMLMAASGGFKYDRYNKGSIWFAHYLLDQGFDLNAQKESGATALFYAALNGNQELVDFYLEKGADLSLTPKGKTLLHAAARGNIKNLVTKLLELGYEVDAKTINKDTPLSLAAEMHGIDVIPLLIAHKADINYIGYGEKDMLMLAAETATKENDALASQTCSLLISFGADPKRTTLKHVSAMELAAKNGAYKTVSAIGLAGAIDEDEPFYRSLRAACENDHIVVFELLSLYEPDFGVHWGDYNLMMAAAKGGNLEIIETLVNAGVSLNHINVKDNHMTALHYAVDGRHPEVVKKLAAAGADLNLRNSDERTPLMLAAKEGQYSTIKILLDHNADANTFDRWGQSPLFEAIYYNRPDIVELLLTQKINVLKKNSKGLTPLELAKQKDFAEIVALLEPEVKAAEIKQAENRKVRNAFRNAYRNSENKEDRKAALEQIRKSRRR